MHSLPWTFVHHIPDGAIPILGYSNARLEKHMLPFPFESSPGTGDGSSNWPLKDAFIKVGLTTNAVWMSSPFNYRTLYQDAAKIVPRTTSGAMLNTQEYLSNGIMAKQLLFDPVTAEYGQFKLEMPNDWDLGPVRARFYWTAGSGTAGDTVAWKISAAARADGDLLDQALGSAISVTDSLVAVNTAHISAPTSAVTVGGSLGVNNFTWWQVSRDPAIDTLAVDAQLMGVGLQYTTTNSPSPQW